MPRKISDVKVDTLPEETYLHFKELVKKGVSLYQFTAIDIRTRIRFLAYGQEKSFSIGWAFIVFFGYCPIPSRNFR